MEVRFLLDRDTNLPHIERHGVEPAEVMDVLNYAQMDYHGRDGARIAIGQTQDGRFLRVVHLLLEDRTQLVITAYDLPAKAKAALRRR